MGPSPEGIDHLHAHRVASKERSCRLAQLGSARQYVSVSPHGGGPAIIAAARSVGIATLPNLRDLGGYPTPTGRRTRWGQIFRSDNLHKLSSSDLVAISMLGWQRVFDLRNDHERQREPNPLDCDALEIISAPPIGDDVPTWLSTRADGEAWLHDQYVGMLRLSPLAFGRILSNLADPKNRPAVFHCVGGKDRTGMVAALLLSALGVERRIVLDDYELTSHCQSSEEIADVAKIFVEAGIAAPAAQGMLSTPRWAMSDALTHLDTEYGGVENYLHGPAAVTAGTLEDLRDQLIH
jgi:protein-tyrosine phosphatase